MVASGEHIGIVDPHWKCIKRSHEGQPAGKKQKLQKFFHHQSHASCFDGIFSLSSQAAKYNATLFRFPLRCIASKISKNIYTATKIKENLFKSFQSEAPIILLFLKNVLKVSLYEWNVTENKPDFLYGVEVHDNCKEMVKSERVMCKQNAEKYSVHSPRTFVQVYTSTFVEKTATESLEHNWLIVNVVGSDNTTLRNLGEDLKVLPWVGVAVQLPHSPSLYNCSTTIDEVNTDTSICRILKKFIYQMQRAPLNIKWSDKDKICTKGQAFCFLPLPCNTALPVHVHGYFAVSDNRRSIKWPSHDEKGEPAEWNKQLLFKLLSPAYAILLACRSSLIHYCEIPALIESTSCITDPYSAWPLYSEVKNQPIWSELVHLTLELASQAPLAWTAAAGGKWVKFTDAYYLPGCFNQFEQSPIAPILCPEITSQVLVEAGIHIVNFPSGVCQTVSSCPSLKRLVTGREVTPKLVRDHIRGKQMNTIISADISQQLDLLDYILSDLDKSTYSELIQIPLLHLLNSHCPLGGTFQLPSISNVMYVFKAEQRVALQFLLGMEHKVIDLEVFPPKIQSQLIDIAESRVLQFQIATPYSISTVLLKESIMTWCEDKDKDKIWRWMPGQGKHPPIQWISKVWLWLNNESINLTELDSFHLPLIPQEIAMSKVHLIELTKDLCLCTLPVLSSAQYAVCHLKPVLQKLGFVIISNYKSPTVFSHPQIQEYVHTATPQLLLSHIESWHKQLDVHCLHDEQKDFLRQFLASRYAHVSAIPVKEKKCLRSLPIYRAGIGISLTRLVCLEDDCLVIPPSNPVPPNQLKYPDNILSTVGVEEISLTLIKKLAVKQLSFDDFCIQCLVPFALQCIQQSLCEWSNGDKIVLWILKQVPFLNSSVLKSFLAKSKLIRTQANFGKSLQPNQLYNPKDEKFCVLFDYNSECVFPSDEYNCVLEGLKCLDLKTWDSMKSCQEMLSSLMLSRSKSLVHLLPHNHTTALKRSKFILTVLGKLARPHSSEFSLWKRIETVQFLFVQSRPPKDYPSCLQWFGQAHQNTLHSIRDICLPSCDHQSSAQLIGSVKLILSEEYGDTEYDFGLSPLSLTGLFYKIKMCDVIQQLSSLIKAVGHNEVEKVNCIVISIYAYLSANTSDILASSLPHEWIWWKDRCQFLPPEKVILQLPADLHTDLEPYLFCIAKNAELNTPKLKELFKFCQIKKLDSDSEPAILIKVMQEIRCKKLSDLDLNIVLGILNWLHKNKYESHGDILMPTVACNLLPATECTFDDREWIRQKTSIPKMSRFVFVHEKVTKYLARYFHVRPLSESVAPSTRLGIKYTSAGPHEEITQRIKHIVQDYGTNIDIFKELIQNADDARATEVKFLIDWRTHSSSSLFGCELQPWQGPALLAYNNAVFSDQDFNHICQLAAETKRKDPLKTGRFGVGFCATYQLTDLPSFISRQYFVMFDPHTSYLGDRVKAREPGIKIDLIENQADLKVYEDQFAPFDNVFGCNVFSLPKEGYRGTLFRFPFRNNETKFKSLISRREYSRVEISHLVESLQEGAEELLIFLKHIRKLTVFEVDGEAQRQIFAVDRDSETTGASLIKQYQSDVTFQTERSSYCHIKACLPKGKISQSKWLLSSAIGSLTGQNKIQALTQNNGLVPLTEIAVKVREVSSGVCIPTVIPGKIFCFLPLPVNTGLPFHTNGLFDIGKDRRSLCVADDETFGKVWNSALAEETLTRAYIHLLASLAVSQLQQYDNEFKNTFLKEYYRLWCLKDAKGIVPQGLVSSVKKYLPSTTQKVVWSEVGSGCWLSPEQVLIFQDYKLRQYQEICQTCVTLLLENGYNVVNVPGEVKSILMPHLREKKQVYDYQRFCIEILFPNIHSVSPDVRDKHLIFLLKKVISHDTEFGWASELIHTSSCIPCQASTKLLPPHKLIDPRESLKYLYTPEEGRFPSVVFQESQSAMAGLEWLGMATRKLKIDDLVERAQTVERLKLNDSGKAYERSYCILQYIERAYNLKTNMYYSKSSSELEVQASLREVSFLPAITKPADIQLPWVHTPSFISPSQAFIPEYKNVVFSQKALVDLESSTIDLSPIVLTFLGIHQNTPTPDIAFSHLECLIEYFSDCDTTSSTVDYLEKEKVMAGIYQHLQKLHPQREHKEWFSEVKQKLLKCKFIWQDGHFLFTNQVVVGWQHDCYPYICDLSQSNKEFEDLFRYLGVQHETSVTITFLAAVLKQIANNHNEEPVSSEVMDFIVVVVKKIVVKSHAGDTDRDQEFFLPDEKGIMRPASQLADNVKGNWVEKLQVYRDHFESGTGYFIHDNIPRTHALCLGARPMLDAVLKGIEDDEFLVGTDYGQHEDLCTRLNQILQKYPPDSSILKEFIQNADDAQASEIVFVFDRRQNYGDKKLFSQDENWKKLQHIPALCVFNNRKFTDKDIQGIGKLGEGGKEQSHEKIGRFGIGFNVAYHLTDCPSFVSFAEGGQPENFCVFDPTCKFVPRSSKINPGRRWRVTEQHRLEFPEQFEPYLLKDLLPLSKLAPECLKNIDDKGFVVFRLPLTRQAPSKMHSTSQTNRGVLGHEQFNTAMVLQLINEFKKTAKDMLLFLPNIRCVSVFEIKEDSTYVHHFTTLTAIKSSHIKKYEEFGSYVKDKMKKADLQSFSPLSVSYQMKVTQVETIEIEDGDFSTKESEEWLIQQVAGSKSLSDTLKQALGCGFRPVGGVAAHTQFNKKRECYSVFCYLPTPIDSHLPVHINGDFLLDDSRKHLETQHGLTDWNGELVTNTIVEAYADFIMEAKALVSTIPDGCRWFYSLFPGSPTDLFSEQLVKAFYLKLLSRNPPILFQATLPGTASSQWLQLQGAHRGLFCVDFMHEEFRTHMIIYTHLKEALIALGMPITSAPYKLYKGFCTIDTDFEVSGRVTPQGIVNYLNAVNLSDATMLFIIKENVEHLLDFLIEGFGKEIVSVLKKLPLLLASDGSLQKKAQIFESRFTTLLPKCVAYFVDHSFEQLSIGEKLEEYHVIIPLSPKFVAEHVELPSTTKAISACPDTLQTVKLVWQHILSIWLYSHHSDNFLRYYYEKPITPANNGKLYPLCMSKAIVDSNSEDMCVLSVLEQIGCPSLDFYALEFSDSESTMLTQLISPCNCSSANDVVQCIKLQESLTYNASLSREEVHTFIECVRKSSAIAEVANRLLHLPLFQTVSESFVSLVNAEKVFILPTDMPADGIADVTTHTQHVILMPCDQYTEEFYRLVIPQFSSIVVSIPTFYTLFVIPRIGFMNDEDLYQHLKYIREHYHPTDSAGDKSDFENVIEMLKETPFIRHRGKSGLVSECCDPDVKFFQVFHSDKVLPHPWRKDSTWFPFFRTLGMVSQVTHSRWLSQAYAVAEEAEGPTISSDLKQRAEALLSSLECMITEYFQRDSDSQNELNAAFADFINEVAQISFIYVDTPPKIQQLLKQLYSVDFEHRQFICFKDSVLSKDAELAGLCRSVLPAACTFDRPPFLKLNSLLLVEVPIKIETVVENLVSLCQNCSLKYIELATGSSTRDNTHALKETFMSHYAQLERMGEGSNYNECLSILKEEACILLSNHDHVVPVLVRPAQVVRSSPSQCHLEPFCYRLPIELLQYEKVLTALAIPEQLQAPHYAMILSNIQHELTKCNEELSNCDTFLKVAESAYNELVRCMRHIPRGDESGIEAEELYLLSEENELLKADALVCNDVPWYVERLNSKFFKYLKPLPPDDAGRRVPPDGLGVRLLSTIITEELHDDMHTPDISCIDEVMFAEGRHSFRCQYVQNLLDSLQSDELFNGLCRVYYHEHNSPPSQEFEKAVRNLQTVHIKCIQTQLKTVLCEYAKPVTGTEDFPFCHLVTESEQHVIYIAPHAKSDEDSFLKQLSSIICKLLGGDVRDQIPICALFECSPSQIPGALNDLRIAMYIPSSAKPKCCHQIGDIVPLKNITPQYLLIIMKYSEGEEVIYHSNDGNFRYAKVVKAITSEKVFEQTLTIQTTDEKDKIASPLQVYKILTPPQRIALFSSHLSTGHHFAAPVVFASVPQRLDDIRKWLQEIYRYLSSEVQHLSGRAICQVTIRLIGHLHYYLVTLNKERDVFPRTVMEIQELVCSLDLPSIVHPHDTPLAQRVDDLLEKLDSLNLEDDCSTEVEDKSECDVPISIMTDGERLNPLPAITSQERIVQSCDNSTSTYTDGYSMTDQSTATAQPQVQSSQGTRLTTARTGYRSAIPLSTSQPQVQSSQGPRFTTTRRGYRSASRFSQPVHACTLPDPPKPHTCIKSAKMWVDQAKADYRAAERLLETIGEDQPLDTETSSDAAENLPSRRACQFPALVCFLCHETVEKVLKAVLYKFCGLKSELLNSSHLVALLNSLKSSIHSPKSLIEPIEECVMQVNEHENKSRLPNYQIPPCAPAVVYTHLDAQGAFSAVRVLLTKLQREESLFGDIGQLPKPKFISTLKSLGDGSEGIESVLIHVVKVELSITQRYK